MGGLGSGGYRHGRRRVRVEECLILNIKRLRKHGVFRGPNGSVLRWDEWTAGAIIYLADRHELVLAFQRHGRYVEQIIPVEQSPCRFGGFHYYFRCAGCGRRATKLFLPLDEEDWEGGPGEFACRGCWSLTYYLQQVKEPSRVASLHAAQAGSRLRGRDLACFELGVRPPWMRPEQYERQYARMIEEANVASEEALQSYAKNFPERWDELMRALGELSRKR